MWIPCSVFVFPSRKSLFVSLVLACFGVCDTLSSDFEPGGRPEINLINPDAEAVIGAVLNIRERGSGLFGCGERKLEGVVTANALKWMVDELNRKIWSESSANMSLGLYIMDSCSRKRTAASQLVDFLPELQTDDKPKQLNPPFKFCVIDDVGLGNEVDISKSLEDINIAVLETNVNINSPQVLVNAIGLFVQELRWEHLAIVHSHSRFSTSMLKQFTKTLKKLDVCVPWVVNVEDENEEAVNAVLDSGVPILSLLPTEEHSLLLRRFRAPVKPSKRIPIIFSDVVSREQVKMIPGNGVQIFSVIQFPERETSFETYYSENSITKGIRTEDDLEVVERTKTVRKVKQIGKKLTEALRTAMESSCRPEERLCPNLLAEVGRHAITESLANTDWTDAGQLYELVEYQYRFSEDHIHLHKIMAYNGHKNLEVFETTIAYDDINCDGENDSRLECRCLEVKAVRASSGRNIDDWGRKKQRNSKNDLEKDKNLSSVPEIEPVDRSLSKPIIYASLNDPLNGTLACLTLLGALLTLIIAQYFATFAALPNGGLTTGTSVLGYVILIGLFLLFSTNLAFLLTPLVSICAIRRLGSSFSYAIIFSGTLIKVWSSLRQATCEKAKTRKPFTLLLYSGTLSFLQVLLTGLWLLLKPPATDYDSGKWICYPYGDLDSHLIISMIYPVALLIGTIILAIRTCSKDNNDEARWILISSSLVAILLSFWGVAVGTGVWEVHRTACTNLAAGTILFLCLYIPKIKMHAKLKKSLKSQSNSLPPPPPPPLPPGPVDLDKECPVFTPSPPYPVVLGYNVVAPVLPEDIIDPNYINQAYSESSDTVSTPFDLESSSYSEMDHEPYTFSTFLEDPQVGKFEKNDLLDDPTQVIPSALYPIEMFNNEPIAITSDHCQPGTNEFTPPHRATSQLYLCPQLEWVP